MRCLFGFALLITAQTALAQMPPAQTEHGRMAPPGAGMAFVPMNPAIQADKEAMAKMMAGMNAPYSGDPDRDFVLHMAPHHQGAIDMAKTELTYGSDPKLKQMAARIVAAQSSEIAFMQAWLARHRAPGMASPDNPNIQYK